jgi:hypothetical protein
MLGDGYSPAPFGGFAPLEYAPADWLIYLIYLLPDICAALLIYLLCDEPAEEN